MTQSSATPNELAKAIRSIGSADFIPAVLDYMRTVTPFRGAFVTLLSPGRLPEHIYDNVRQERRSVVVDRWLDRAWLLDPFVVTFISDRFDPIMVLDDVAPDRFAQTDYFNIYYKSVRLKDELAVFVPLSDSTLFFSLGRLVGEMRFSRRDVRRLLEAHQVVSALCEQHFHRSPRNAPNQLSGAMRLDTVIEKLCNGLTRREIEIVQHLLRGHSSQSIALLLDLSPATVKVHRKNIYRKLGISSQSALFSIFLQSVI
ncbi:transcriptional regulator NarP [Thalassovita gelatinovora]|uniref:Transcriptional regulator NarP n=1 Tax=Thalassovita gelatinovora TaxID=53501 RepID=A0A0P1G3X9_THAGE|nr:LuxR family transcriptional regulator [Thalassovita gelatinovora]QIZ82316.1 helix-turn-helix transcriptional regulator [Thalassovita gelatinovora]CUH68367.1 transcriptional regulator NarP [Thalassovita gelatinovora]SER19266.1 regulatory protein, luxR family [Thalassovita gelatinovora]